MGCITPGLIIFDLINLQPDTLGIAAATPESAPGISAADG